MTRIPLSRTYTVASETFAAVTVRAPTFADYRQLGDAYEVQRGVVVTHHDVLFAYVDRLVTEPAAGALQALDLEDALAVSDAVLGFFFDARVSLNKRKTSSSGSDGNRDTSTV